MKILVPYSDPVLLVLPKSDPPETPFYINDTGREYIYDGDLERWMFVTEEQDVV